MNPRRRSPADLQSAPFGHLGTSPFEPWTPVGLAPPAGGRRSVSKVARGPPGLLTVELAKGIEPPACCLQGSRSTPELRQQATKLHPMYRTRLRVNPFLPGRSSGRAAPGPGLPLSPDLVQEGRPRGRDVERPHPPGEGNPDQEVARPGHQGPEPPALAPQDQDQRPPEVGRPGGRAAGAPPSATAPTIQHPSCFSRSSAWPRFPTRATGRYSRAPAAARTTWGVSPAAWCRGTSTPWTPRASAVRSRFPTFPGSWTWSRARNRAGSPRVAGTASRSSSSAYSRGATRATTPWWWVVPARAVRAARGTRLKRTPACRASARMSACAVPAFGLDQHLLDRPGPAPERLQHRVPAGQDQDAGRRPLFRFHFGPARGVLDAPRPARPAPREGRPPAPSHAGAAPRPAPPPGRRSRRSRSGSNAWARCDSPSRHRQPEHLAEGRRGRPPPSRSRSRCRSPAWTRSRSSVSAVAS